MATYYECYDDYDDPGYSPTWFSQPELVYVADPYDEHITPYDGNSTSQSYEGYDGPEYEDESFAIPSYEAQGYVDAEEPDDGCMRTAYGEPGYWEEYHRRRYAILYGPDSEEEGDTQGVSERDEDLVVDPAAAYDDPDSSGEYGAAGAMEELNLNGDEDEEAWREMWERGPPPGENELAWADAMEVWRQRLELDPSYGEDGGSEVQAVNGHLDVDTQHAPEELADAYVEEAPLDDVPAQLTLEELQSLYDSGGVPEEDREECARLLEELWACELEHQRLQAAGYVWDEELGEYVHPDGSDSSEEYDAQENDLVGIQEHADAYSAAHVLDLPLTALAGAPTPSFVSDSIPPPELPKHQATPRRRSPKPAKLKSPLELHKRRHRMILPAHRQLPPPLPHGLRSRLQRWPNKGRTKLTKKAKRDPPPHVAPVASSARSPAVVTSPASMNPAPSATPPPVVDDSRCSLATASIAAVDVPNPDDPTKPPNTHPAAHTSASVSPSAPVHAPATTTVLRVALLPYRPLCFALPLPPLGPSPTDASWRAATDTPGFEAPTFDDSDWATAYVFGSYDMGPSKITAGKTAALTPAEVACEGVTEPVCRCAAVCDESAPRETVRSELECSADARNVEFLSAVPGEGCVCRTTRGPYFCGVPADEEAVQMCYDRTDGAGQRDVQCYVKCSGDFVATDQKTFMQAHAELEALVGKHMAAMKNTTPRRACPYKAANLTPP
ncbi:hypothetical protein B0H15DRAFT_1027951 [Mycena belliarum]|uniref:Uncharacterized protein n=1 Tax=Mycena belliarum TaxID=1033014 RepID=A0AAD6XHU2_9AGAR|nr:hypothetical protein B0H15DRAFT_1027951 [Mycena belliae]